MCPFASKVMSIVRTMKKCVADQTLLELTVLLSVKEAITFPENCRTQNLLFDYKPKSRVR